MSGFATLFAQQLEEGPLEVTQEYLDRLRSGVAAMDELLGEWEDAGGPLEHTANRPLRPAPRRRHRRQPVPHVGTRVLLVTEDDDDYFHLIRSLLADRTGRSGWELVRAVTLADARRILTGNDPPVCSVVDLGLPDSGSLDTLAELRSAAPGQPIVVVTGSDRTLGIEAVRLGAQDYLVKPGLTREVLERSIDYAIERARVEARLVHQSLHDEMTGLANRALLFDRLKLALSRLDHHPALMALMFVDIDRFKIVNDSLGHQIGDELLIEVARRIESRFRRSDTVARVGGDEFVVLVEDLVDDATPARLAEELLATFSEPFACGGGIHRLTASVGVAVADSSCAGPELLLANADTAMYRAKERGRARWELFDDEMRTRLVTLFQLERGLSGAARDGELEVWYQPVVELRSARPIAVEALIRWRHPERGLIGPDEFLRVAEDSGQIEEIGGWVLAEACAQAERWAGTGILPKGFTMWVNVSSRQLDGQALEQRIRDLLGTRRRTWVLGLEVTESALIQDLAQAAAVLAGLREWGIRVAIDDFGTGFSSLSWLRRMPIDQLKIDGSFVADLGERGGHSAIVQACLGLGQALGIGCTAEGVERPEQRRALEEMGCETAQGFLFSPPLAAAEAEQFLRGRAGARP